MHTLIEPWLGAGAGRVEVVEHKGVGHPDTICDALAEEASLALCRLYLDRTGAVRHHNVDKALLWGGVSRPQLGAPGAMIEPMRVYLAGRATMAHGGVSLPVREVAHAAMLEWLRTHLRHLDVEHHVRIEELLRPASVDLGSLFARGTLANDTSIGVGFAPASELETTVLRVADWLRARAVDPATPWVGDDVKIMAVRADDGVELTIACAIVGAFVRDIPEYLARKAELAEAIASVAREGSARPVGVVVNAADEPESGSVYVTVTGLSAEAGDDGEVGRGNRVGGLITPFRPMSTEAAAGKNPVTHVGKLYNVAASRIARALVERIDPVEHAHVTLVSRIGAPVTAPALAHVRLTTKPGVTLSDVEPLVRARIEEGVSAIPELWRDLLNRSVRLY